MKAYEILNKAKELLSVEAEEVKLAREELENGTIIEAESFEEGKEIFIVTEEEKVALPVGKYSLKDGRMLEVKEEGIIGMIGEEPKEEEAEEEPMSEEVEASEDNVEEVEAKEEVSLFATKEELSELKQAIEDLKTLINQKNELLSKEEEKKEEKETLSVQTETIEKISHNPEAKNESTFNLYSHGRAPSTYDRVLERISNIKN